MDTLNTALYFTFFNSALEAGDITSHGETRHKTQKSVEAAFNTCLEYGTYETDTYIVTRCMESKHYTPYFLLTFPNA